MPQKHPLKNHLLHLVEVPTNRITMKDVTTKRLRKGKRLKKRSKKRKKQKKYFNNLISPFLI